MSDVIDNCWRHCPCRHMQMSASNEITKKISLYFNWFDSAAKMIDRPQPSIDWVVSNSLFDFIHWLIATPHPRSIQTLNNPNRWIPFFLCLSSWNWLKGANWWIQTNTELIYRRDLLDSFFFFPSFFPFVFFSFCFPFWMKKNKENRKRRERRPLGQVLIDDQRSGISRRDNKTPASLEPCWYSSRSRLSYQLLLLLLLLSFFLLSSSSFWSNSPSRNKKITFHCGSANIPTFLLHFILLCLNESLTTSVVLH